jgi:eukaryotic-like serine/threonine-protein kinase
MGEGTKGLGTAFLPGDLAAGTAVGEYLVEGVLGRGGMGTVYAARHPLIGKQVAIKVLGAAFSQDPAIVRRFVDEARAVNRIGHAGIIDIFSFGTLADGRQYFVMEHLEGETLGAALRRGPLPAAEARRLLVETCAALQAAHSEHIVHRDLKPDNLWIARPRHGEPHVKILDFGIAKLIPGEGTGDSSVTETGAVMGTPQFMAPEQCLGEPVDHRADIYALGVILYRVFCGRLPFEGKSFAEVVAQMVTVAPPRPSSLRPLAPALEALILACLEKSPGQRPQSADEVGRRLEAALAAGGGTEDDADETMAARKAAPVATAAAPVANTPAGITAAPEGATAAEVAAMAAMAPTRRRWWYLAAALALIAFGSLAAILRGGPPSPDPMRATAPPRTVPAVPANTPAVVEPEAQPAGNAPAATAPAPAASPPRPAPQPPRQRPQRLPWGRKNPYE